MAPAEFARKLEQFGLYRFTGTIDAGGVPIHAEILAGYKFGRPQFAIGFSFDKESYGKLAEKLSGIKVDFLDSLGIDLEVSAIIIFCVSFKSVPVIDLFNPLTI